MIPLKSHLRKEFRPQRTIKRHVEFSGIGIHTGRIVHMRFCPAKDNTGIVFKRVDLPHTPIIPASVQYVCDTSRSTIIGIQDVRIHTVEHVLAAVKSFQIDNLVIELNEIEPPVANGSSDTFVAMLEKAEIQEQQALSSIVYIDEPIYFSDKDIHLVALPYQGYKISYTLHYPHAKLLSAQYFSFDMTQESFKKEIAPCRTFSLYKEISWLMDNGLIKGGSLDNAVVIHDDAIISKEGLYFPNEMARHKILDLIGDLSLIGCHFYAHIISIKSGHTSNYNLAKKMLTYIKEENC